MRPWRWFGPISGPCGSRESTATMTWSQRSQTDQANPELPGEEGFVQLCPKKRIKMNSAGNRRNDALPSRTPFTSPLSSPQLSCQAMPVRRLHPPEQTRELGWVGREYQPLSPLHWGKWLLGAQDQGEPCLRTLVWVIFPVLIQ